MKQQTKHFYNTADFSQKEIWDLIGLALKLKRGKISNSLSGKTLAMLFFNPSLRTRVSFTVAMQKLGGQALDIPVKEGGSYTFEFEDGAVMDKGTIEHVKEAARILSRYADAIAIRSSELITSAKESVAVSSWQELKKDTVINSFIQYATVPVINMESNVYHPCQGLGDMATMMERLLDQEETSKENPFSFCKHDKIFEDRIRDLVPRIGTSKKIHIKENALRTPHYKALISCELENFCLQTKARKYVLTWVPHPKALPMATPNSQILSACDLGMEVVVAYPPEWELDSEIMSVAEKRVQEAGGSLSFTYNQKKALAGAKFVCAKSWGAAKYYGNWEKEKKLRENYKDWIIDGKKMKLTNDAYFLHCLPVRRNVEVTDEVLDSPRSLIYEEAENRMWVQMAILKCLL